MHLMLRPGTDGALACAVMHVLFAEGYADRAYLARYADDPAELEAHLGDRTPEWAAAITGVPAETIGDFARALRPHQAQLHPRRLRLLALAQRRGQLHAVTLPAGGDRRLAARGRRRALFQPRALSHRQDADRGLRPAGSQRPRARPVAHRAGADRRQARPRRRPAGDGAAHPEHQPDGGLPRTRNWCATASRATTCSSACTSSS